MMDHEYLYNTHNVLLKDNRRAYQIIRRDKDIAKTIELYKGSLSYEINAFLREEKRIFNVTRTMLSDMACKLSQIIQMSTLSSSLMLYRVVFGEYAAMLSRSELRTKFDSCGFASWTFDSNQAFNFDMSESRITLLRMTLPKGAHCFYIDGMHGTKSLYQSEVLTDKHTTFEIMKKTNVSYFPNLHMMQRGVAARTPFDKKKTICIIDIAQI
jgi:hypothetical protein